jgi:hypothetical protein
MNKSLVDTKKKLWCVVAIAMLGLLGCAFKVLDEALPKLVGKPIEAAVNVLGLPNAQMELAGNNIFIWNNQRSGTVPIYNTSTANTYGTVGTTPVYGTTTTSTVNYVPVSYHCEIKVSVDSQNIIQRVEYYGNQGGCQRYADSVKSLTQ